MQNNKLNILIYPMLSVDNINADSNFIIIKQICNELAKTGRYNFILILDENRQYIKDNLHSSVKIIKIPFPKAKKHQVIHFNTNILRQIFSKYPIDIIWNNVVEQGHHFKYFQDTLDQNIRWKVFNYHHYVIHRSLEYLTNYLPCTHIMYDQIIGSLAADINYFHTNYCYEMLMEEAKDILLDSQIQKIKGKSVINLGGYGKEIISNGKYEKFTFIYNHRLDGYKNWKKTFQIFDELYSKGLEFQVVISAGDKDNINVINKKPYTIVKSFTKHQDYLVELSKCHANVTNSKHETYCISIAESILNDQIIIAPKKCTFPELVEKGYPYLFSNDEEQIQIMEKVIKENIREYRQKDKDKLYIEKHSKFIDEQFQKLCEITKDPYFDRIKKESTQIAIKQFVKNKNEIQLQEFKNFVYKLGYASQSFPLTKLKAILQELGYQYEMVTDLYKKPN